MFSYILKLNIEIYMRFYDFFHNQEVAQPFKKMRPMGHISQLSSVPSNEQFEQNFQSLQYFGLKKG